MKARKLLEIVSAAIIATVLAATIAAATANAMPRKYRGRPTATRAGITYLSAPADCNDPDGTPVAIVIRVRKNARRVTIPARVRIAGRTHRVTTVWPDTLSRARKLQRVTIKGRLDVAEDLTLLRRDARRVKIICKTRYTYDTLSAGTADIARR